MRHHTPQCTLPPTHANATGVRPFLVYFSLLFLQAGNAAASFLGLTPSARVLPVEPDEPQVAAAKDFLRTQRQVQQLVTGGFSSALASLTGRSTGRSTSSSAAGGYMYRSARAAAVAAPAAAPSVAAEQQPSSSSSSSGGSAERVGELSLLQRDEQLQELLRDEVIEQVAEQDMQRQQQQQAAAPSGSVAQ